MKVLANDSITLTKIIDGIDGTNSISVILSSYAINLPSNSEGAIIDYSNSQVDIIVLEGQKSLTPTLNASLSNGQFRLKNTILKNIGSIAQPAINKDKIKTGVISQFTSNQDSGSAEFEIEYKTSTGDINTVNMTLTFTKAKQGLAGTPGKDGKPVFTSIRYSNEICDRENFIPTTATINPNADTFSIGVYTGEIDYDSPNNHWEQNLDKYKWSAYGQQSIKEIKTTFKATSSMNKPNSVDFKDTNIPSDFNAQNKYLWKKDIYFYNGTNTTTESINLIATYGKDGQSANTLSATSGSYSINKSEVIITGNSAHTDILNSTGTNLFVYNYDGSLAEKINYNTYSDPNLCNTLLAKIQGLRDKIFVLMECDSGSMTQQLRNELILSGGSQTDIWNKQRRAWIFISLSKKSTNNQYPLQKGQAYEVSNIGDNKKENLTVSLTGSGIVANGSTGTGIISIQTKYQATNNASKPTQGWGDSIWSITIPTLTDDKKYLYSITRYTYSDNRTTDIIDLISVKGSDGENGKILYQDTVPVAPSIGTQWFNTGTNNGYINNTLYVFDGKNWKVMEFSAENIKTNVLNALQANMDNTNISHKLIVGNKTGKRVELDGYNGTLTIYNSNNQKIFYTGADGNLNFQGNLSFSSGSSVSQAIDKKADTSYVNNKVDNISIGGTNILKNTEKMDNSTGNYWVSEGNVILQDGVATVKQAWASREYLLDDLNKYIENNDVKNKKYILSVDIMRTTQDVISNTQIRFYLEQSGSHAAILVDDLSKLPINKWVRKSVPIILLGQNETSLTKGRFRIECTTNNEWKFRRMKLEEGTKATDWSPSPEDKASQSDLNSTNEKIDNISVGGTNLLQNSDPMPTLVSYPATQDSTMDADWQKFTTNISGKEVLPKDNAKYMLQLQTNMDIVQSIMVQTDGQVNSAQFTFYDTAHHIIDAKIKLISDGNGVKTYQLWCNYKTNGNKFRCIDLKTINYTGNYIKFKHPMIEQGNIPTGWSPDPRDTQTQINQTKNKISLIADIKENESDLNPDAAINVYIDKSQPEGHQGTVSIGANNKFLIRADTEVEKNFKLSANNISAGLIKAKQPQWMIEGVQNNTIPVDFSNSEKYCSKLILDDDNEDISLSLYPKLEAPLVSGGKYKYTTYSQLNGYSLNFQNLYWSDSKILSQSNPAMITSYFDLNDISNTALRLSVGRITETTNDTSLYITTSAPWKLYQQGYDGVVVGKDSSNKNKSALFANTVYTNRIQSGDDTTNVGILIDDKLLLNEGVWSDWSIGGKQTGINFPNKNSGDIIELHTAEGDKNGSWFSFINGNWDIKATTKTPKGQRHAIVPAGNGYTIAFSNTETDNAQGDASATIIAKEYLTTSSKELKDKIEPINNIEQAVEDILKIEPKQYYYKTQLEKIKEWEEKGKPENEYENLDTEINIGFIAEDLEAYNSLRPFITKATDDYGNERILGIDYSKFVPLLLAVCQKQDNKINQLEEQIIRLKLLMNKNFK